MTKYCTEVFYSHIDYKKNQNEHFYVKLNYNECNIKFIGKTLLDL